MKCWAGVVGKFISRSLAGNKFPDYIESTFYFICFPKIFLGQFSSYKRIARVPYFMVNKKSEYFFEL
jgi:hypothetical protein